MYMHPNELYFKVWAVVILSVYLVVLHLEKEGLTNYSLCSQLDPFDRIVHNVLRNV